MRSQILIVPVFPDGPTAVAGDSNPPAEFVAHANQPLLHIRFGIPPDSLSGLQLARDWNGRPAAATVLSLGPDHLHWIETAVHEAFHSFQRRAGGTGVSMLPLPFDEKLLAVAVLEGRALAGAATAPDDSLRSRIDQALSIRAQRCRLLGDDCARLRALEGYEGAAKYVASLSLLGRDALLARVTRDTTSVYSVLRPPLEGLARFHVYGTGELWLVLLDRLKVPGWPEEVAGRWGNGVGRFPDELVARAAGRAPPDTTVALLETPEGQAAVTHVRAEVAAARARRAARVTPTPPATHSLIRIQLPPNTQVGMSMGPLRGGGRQVRTVIGNDLIVVQQRFGEQRHSAWAPVAGRTISVDGREIPLDKPGEATGTVVLDLPEIRARLSRASVKVAEREVVITYLP